MHKHTGEIRQFRDDEQIPPEYVPIPPNDVGRVTRMTFAERKAWLKRQRRAEKRRAGR